MPPTKKITNNFGVSFSIKQCRSFDINPHDCLDWLINEGGFMRFRLMSYWNEHEPTPGAYDFTELDWQIKRITKAGGTVSLCLGARQPRWPENHWPDWAWELSKPERTKALLKYIETVVERYRDEPAITTYQLENEALLKEFGQRPEVDRDRLLSEYRLVKQLDPERPIIMTTSTSWGIPVRKPIPDMVGFSYYQVHFNPTKLRYTTSFHTPLLHRMRAFLIRILHRKPSFIHELQLEPWGPKNIWEMTLEEQDISMSPEQIQRNIALARATKLQPIDLWGGEWWYWRTVIKQDTGLSKSILESVSQSAHHAPSTRAR